ncbi:hypothetical protein EYF80_027612 [Liparis tanakae]|uniref:Uncharacterized protein n=1 Tax=Liparis tanakae TaxID=230148 RepID=A0A4Z2HBS2_9TELE|nr:hypothetical protein EYF80_027612 [Liparis tanakae]
MYVTTCPLRMRLSSTVSSPPETQQPTAVPGPRAARAAEQRLSGGFSPREAGRRAGGADTQAEEG